MLEDIRNLRLRIKLEGTRFSVATAVLCVYIERLKRRKDPALMWRSFTNRRPIFARFRASNHLGEPGED
ncbi:hypothetical protein Csa_013974 [Cucumis sativus]|uniref:Uncharacterized protein n=1 Tax=Cucumis sativus TaxID=3659 RepID=A0A0A0LRP4_CUCSA|nr:hypothetical protein Csa_013974 [Cucumis sativus]